MSNVMQIAVDHRARLEAEVAKIEKFLSFADMLTQHGEKPVADLPLEECERVAPEDDREDDRIEMFKSAPEVAPTAEREELTLSEPSPAPSPAAPPADAPAPQAAREAAPAPQPEAREEAPVAPAAEASPEPKSLQDSLDALKRALKQ